MRFFSKKKLIILGIIILGLMALYFLIPQIYFFYNYYYPSWKIGRAYKEFEKGFLDYLRKDTFGGKTPEETYNLYLDALKKGDLELASKYYWWERQVKEKERLEKLAEEGKLQDYIDSLPHWSEMEEEEYWDPDGRRYSYKYVRKEDETFYDILLKRERTIPAGEYEGEITFQLNKQANIWKLY